MYCAVREECGRREETNKTVTEVMRVGKRGEQGGSHMLFNVVLIIELYESATYSKKKRHYLKAF